MPNQIDFSSIDIMNSPYFEEEEVDEFGNPIDPNNPPLPEFAPEKATWLEDWFGNDTYGVDFMSDMYRAVKQGWASSDAVDETFDLFKGDLTDEKLDAYQQAQKDAQEYGPSEEAQEYQYLVNKYKSEGDSGAWAGLKAILQNPSFGVETIISSMVGAAGTIFDSEEGAAMAGAGAGVGAAAGAGIGAAATSWGGPLAAIGGSIGAGTGAVSGAFGGAMAALETTSTFADLLREKIIENGGNPDSNEDIRAVLENPEEMSDLRWKSAGRGLTIGATEALFGLVSAGVGGKIMGGAAGKLASKTGAKAFGATTLIEGVGGSLGEVGGMLAAGQELAGDEILLEGIAGTAMAPAQLYGSIQDAKVAKKKAEKSIEDSKPVYKVNDGETTADQISEMLKAPGDDFMNMKFNIINDEALKAQVQKKRESILSDKDIRTNIENLDEKKPPEGGGAGATGETINFKAAENHQRRIQPKVLSESIERKNKEKLKLSATLLESKEKGLNTVSQGIRKDILDIDNSLIEADNKIINNISNLNPKQGARLMELNDEYSIYESVYKDETSTDNIKKVAFDKLQDIKTEQAEIFNSYDNKNIELSKKAQEIFENEGVEAYDKIIDSQEGLIRKIAIDKLNKVPKNKRRQGDVEALVSQLKYGKEGAIGIIQNYDPAKNPSISSYLGQLLKRRVHRAAKAIVPQLEAKDFAAPEVANVIADETGMTDPVMGPKVLADLLKLPTKLIDKAKKAIPAALLNVKNALTTDKGKELSKKKRIALAEKSISDIIEGRVLSEIKTEFGKNTKTKKDFDNYLNKNWVPLTQAFLAQKSITKGEGVAKNWSMFPPSQKQVKDYFNGTDIVVGEISKKTGKPITEGQKSRAVADRKASLAEAVSKQFALELQEEYLEQNPKEREALNKESNKDVAEDNIIMFSSKKAGTKDLQTQILENINQQYAPKIKIEGNPDGLRAQQVLGKLLKESGADLTNTPDFNTAEGRKQVYDGLMLAAKRGLLSASTIKAAKLDAFGAMTKEGDPTQILTTDEGYVKKNSDKWKKAFKERRLIEKYTRGGLFYSSKDPLLVKLLEVADENYIDKTADQIAEIDKELQLIDEYEANFNSNKTTKEKKKDLIKRKEDLEAWQKSDKQVYQVKMKDQLGLSQKDLKGKKGSVNPKKFKEIVKKHNKAVKQNQQIVKNAILDVHRALKNGVSIQELKYLLIGMYQATRGAVKASYQFDSYETGAHAAWREEHSPPVNEFIGDLFKAIFAFDNEADLSQRIDDMYADANQFLISVEADNKINAAGFKMSSPARVGKGASFSRLVKALPEVFLNNIVDADGKSIAEKFDAPLDGLTPNPDLESKQLPVVEQNSQPTETMMLNARDKRFNNKEKIELTEAETTEAFLDILGGNWNRDGSTDMQVFTDPNEMMDILIKDHGQTEIQAKRGVEEFGFKIGNKIFINLNAKKGLETAVHEAGHVWNSIVYKAAPKIWNGIISRVKESGLWDKYYKIVKDNGSYNDIIQQYEDGSNTFNLENEIFARILEDVGGKKVKSKGSKINQIKEVIKQYFNELALALGFDPTTKNFGDLTLNEMIDLAVSEVVTGDPLANFSKLKDSKDKSWFRKTKANIDPAFKASIDPEYQGLNSLVENYRTNGRNLLQAIKDSYGQVKDIMSLKQWTDFVMKTVGEVQVGKTPADKGLVVAKKDAIKNEKLRQKKISLLKEAGQFKKGDENLTSIELDKKLKEIDSEIRSKQKEKNKKEGLNKGFRKILNSVTGKWGKPSKWFVPPSAEDIKGLLYAFLPGGAAGVAAKKFFKSTLLDPYYKGVAAAEAEILQRVKSFSKLLKESGIDLTTNVEGTPYSIGQAIKVYNWVKQGIDVDVKKSEYIQSLVDAIENNPDLKAFAEQIENNFPIEYNAEWRNDSFNKSIYQEINSGTRKKYLEVFSDNVDQIFDKDNLQEIENKYGRKFRQTLERTLNRMKTGKNRVSTDSQSNSFLTWVNRAVATTMFVNTRSAVLQTLSALNFIGKPNNNIFQATSALFSGSWKKDFDTLWNSDYLKARREGAKFDVLADEISEGDVKGLNKLLKWGFLPTRMADSFAIALGGAAFYRNTVNALMKDGMSEADAKKAAMQQWVEAAEESQQSSDPSKISEIQSSNVGKVIYAFANTPFQYVRKQKRHLQDVASGRSYAEGGMDQVRRDLQSVLYYSIGQAILFNGLQTALFAVGFEDDEEKKKEMIDDKTALAVERALTSYSKSLGNPGAVTAAIYSVMAEASEQIEKYGKIDDSYKLALEATSISPPLNAKLRDIVAIGNAYKYNAKQIEEDPLKPSLDNAVFEIAGNAASLGGVPLDRVLRKSQNLAAIANDEAQAWQQLFLLLGWNKWDLGMGTRKNSNLFNRKLDFNNLKTIDFDDVKKLDFDDIEKLDFDKIKKKSPFDKRLPKGVIGRANGDGTIHIAKGLSPEKFKKTLAHELEHDRQMKSGDLSFTDNYITHRGKKYERKDGKIKFNGKFSKEGSPRFPWEAEANRAEANA